MTVGKSPALPEPAELFFRQRLVWEAQYVRWMSEKWEGGLAPSVWLFPCPLALSPAHLTDAYSFEERRLQTLGLVMALSFFSSVLPQCHF